MSLSLEHILILNSNNFTVTREKFLSLSPFETIESRNKKSWRYERTIPSPPPQGPFRYSLLKHFLSGHRNITAITISRTIRTPFLNINEAVASSILIAFNRVNTRVWKSFFVGSSVNTDTGVPIFSPLSKWVESRSIIGQVECGWSRWLWSWFWMILVKR